jgi:hypothetical protein
VPQELEQENEVAEQVADNEAEEAAGFNASFSGASDETPPADEAETDGDEQPETPEASAEAGDTEEAEQQGAPVLAGLSETQLTALLAKLPKIDDVEQMTAAEIRKLHGKYGEINRALQDLRSGTGRPAVRLDAAKFKRLQEHYPEIAEMLAEDLNESADLVNGQQAPSVDVDSIVDQRVQAAREEMERKLQVSLLNLQHRDWRQVTGSDDFKVWAQTLPPEDQQQLQASWDAYYLADKISEFKAWRDKRTQGSQQRQARLERAITPKGGAAVARSSLMTEEEGFEAAFRT